MSYDTNDRLPFIADLLLGAAYADGTLEGQEEEAVRALLKDLLGTALPAELEARVAGFNPAQFDLARCASVFANDDDARKRKLLELVVSVHDSDEVLHSAEDDYLVAVAHALGLSRDVYGDLAMEFEYDELRDALEDVRHPPPLPTGN